MSTKTAIAKYVLLPGFIPRIRDFFGTGFVYIAYYIAVLYNIVRLLPNDHPYLNPKNFGRYGIRHVIAEAANNIVLDKKHLDQICVFVLVFAGLIIFAVQFFLVILAVAAQPVYAGGASFTAMFVIPSTMYAFGTDYDIALMTLDRVFGVVGIFNSCVSTTTPCLDEFGDPIATPGAYPWPIHLALHSLFRFYSIGISIISLIIILYFITTIIGETAVTGTPFGQRFNKAWAPIRLIAFFALIAPLNMGGNNAGLNGAQIITLWAAKHGSNFSTNAWGLFNNTTHSIIGGRLAYYRENLVAIPNAPNIGNIAQFMSLMNACIYVEDKVFRNNIKAYIVRHRSSDGSPDNSVAFTSNSSPDFDAALAFTEYNDIHVVYGIKDSARFSRFPGHVKPICGEAVLPVGKNMVQYEGDWWAHAVYYNTIAGYLPGEPYAAALEDFVRCEIDRTVPYAPMPCTNIDFAQTIRDHVAYVQQRYNKGLELTIKYELQNTDFAISDELLRRGWAGAALWYNKLADLNGDIASGMFDVPQVKHYPIIMESVRAQQVEQAETILYGPGQFNPFLPDDSVARFPRIQDASIASAYHKIYAFWDAETGPIYNERAESNNPVIDTINAVFGTGGLFNMRNPGYADFTGSGTPDYHPGNMEVHPLALLSSLGKTLLEASIRNLGVAAGGALGGGMLSILGDFAVGQAALQSASSMFKAIGTATILIGAILFYVLPFMPFIYFLFALGGWVKSIFEAMVAMPLWALSHLRIDGEGLPGPGATNGYFLILEIFLRPILILFGLIASTLIFTAMVRELHNLFDIMVDNVGGAEAQATPGTMRYYRGPIDQFMFTIMYTVIVYMIGLSCFKLIDQIPNSILRWMGVSVSTFQETAGDPASQLSSSVYRGGNLAVGQISGALDSGKAAALIS